MGLYMTTLFSNTDLLDIELRNKYTRRLTKCLIGLMYALRLNYASSRMHDSTRH